MTDQKFDKDTYPTSISLFNPIHAEFGFTIDGAALPHNAKLERYVTPEMDYLTYPLQNERIFINPPFSDPLSFIKRSVELFENYNCLVLCCYRLTLARNGFP